MIVSLNLWLSVLVDRILFLSEDRAEKQCLFSYKAKDKDVITSKTSGHRMLFFIVSLVVRIESIERLLRIFLLIFENHTAVGSCHQCIN